MKRELDSGMIVVGVLLGALFGGLVTLFNAPKTGRAFRQQFSASVNETGQNIRAGIEAAIPTDPVAESMAEGKAAARRRMEELGEL